MSARHPCGTRAAYREHLANHEVPDEACLRANRIHTSACRERAARGRRQQNAMFRELLGLIASACREEGILP